MSLGPEFDVKEQVRQATDIVELVQGYVPLKRMGANYAAICPWHEDSRPSLQVNPARQSWKCWVCDIGGDAFSFVMRYENIDFRQALEQLARSAGIEIPTFNKSKPSSGDKQKLYDALTWARKQFQKAFREHPEAESARQYVDSRGINDDCIENFQIGFTPNRWDWLLGQADQSEFDVRTLEQADLIGKRDAGVGHFDRFRGRLMFPINDLQGRTLGFGGRILPEIAAAEEQAGNNSPKYINSRETRLYSKSNNLYGLSLGRESVRKSKQLVIVEGYTDVIMAHQFGFENVTACLGTAINENHIRLFKRFSEEVVLILDGDEAGQNRTNDLLDLFVASELNMKIAVLPDGLDPCDLLIEKGKSTFQEFIDKAVDALEHKFKIETDSVDLIGDTHSANRALERILATLGLTSKKTGAAKMRQQQMLSRLARKFRLREEDIRSRFEEILSTNRKMGPKKTIAKFGGDSTTPANPYANFRLDKCDPREVELIELILAAPHVFQATIENISPDQFVMGPLREIYETFVDVHRRDREPDFNSVMTVLDQDGLKNLLVAIDEKAGKKQESTPLPPERRLDSIVLAFEKKLNETIRNQIVASVDQPGSSDDDEVRMLEQLAQLKKVETNTKDNGHDVSAPMDG